VSSLVAQLRKVLLADPDVEALVGDRVHAVKAPDGVEKPYVVVAIISDVPESTLSGSDADALSTARVQVTAWSDRYEEAHDIDVATTAVVAALKAPAPGLSAWKASGPLDLYDDEANLFGASTDFNVWR
jgi:hypothetical protein